MEKITTGQTVYYQRIYGGNTLQAGTVDKVGRKYFTVKELYGARFEIEGLRHEAGQHSPSYKIWLSIEEYKDTLEHADLLRKISSAFGLSGKRFTLEQLRAIHQIITQ